MASGLMRVKADKYAGGDAQEVPPLRVGGFADAVAGAASRSVASFVF